MSFASKIAERKARNPIEVWQERISEEPMERNFLPAPSDRAEETTPCC